MLRHRAVAAAPYQAQELDAAADRRQRIAQLMRQHGDGAVLHAVCVRRFRAPCLRDQAVLALLRFRLARRRRSGERVLELCDLAGTQAFHAWRVIRGRGGGEEGGSVEEESTRREDGGMIEGGDSRGTSMLRRSVMTGF